MTVPGCNVLAIASRVIAFQAFQYNAYAGRTVQSNGQQLTNYAAPVPFQGSVQPVPRQLYQEYGLQFDKNYYTVFVPLNIVDVTRDTSGDQITYNGNTLQVVQKTNWFAADGWVQMLCIQVLAPG
jgi:hypothetical protein